MRSSLDIKAWFHRIKFWRLFSDSGSPTVPSHVDRQLLRELQLFRQENGFERLEPKDQLGSRTFAVLKQETHELNRLYNLFPSNTHCTLEPSEMKNRKDIMQKWSGQPKTATLQLIRGIFFWPASVIHGHSHPTNHQSSNVRSKPGKHPHLSPSHIP